MKKKNWPECVHPLISKYKRKPHPLEHHSVYQLLIMVILSAQDSDKHINQLAPALFKAFPDMKSLSKATEQDVLPYVNKIRNFGNKAKWLVSLAQTIKTDKNIPKTLDELVKLPGIGRKSANVILRESGQKAEGVIVDLHVIRVAPRLGIGSGTDPKKIEKQIMEVIPQKDWGEIGMAISFLGREICRPKPQCEICLMRTCCDYYAELTKKKPAAAKKKKS